MFVCIGCSSNKEVVDCSDAMCTDEYISISISILYGDGSPVKLDSYEVREVKTGKLRDVPNWGEEFHTCIIASDLDREDFYNKKVKLLLIGKKAGKVVVQENYLLTADCCHISLLKGDKTVIIKP